MKLSDLFSHWDQVHKDTLSVIDRFSEAELAHVSYVGGWPVGQIALQIADAENGWIGYIATKDYAAWPPDHTLEDYPTKEAIKVLLSTRRSLIFEPKY